MADTERPISITQRLRAAARRAANPLAERAVRHGLPPGWLGYRWVEPETVKDAVVRGAARAGASGRWSYETVHAPAQATNPLPRNVANRSDLPADPGWWGYSFYDVPTRAGGETFIATVPDARIAWYTEPSKNNFYPAILSADGRALNMREVVFRPGHGEVLRRGVKPARIEKATWILERVYHNHSHWLTAHLPKLCLLRERGELDGLILPRRRNAVIDASLRMLGLEPDRLPTFDPDRPLEVGELTILGTDRFRPELLRMVRDALGVEPPRPPHRRVFISRARSRGRHLVDEEEIWPLLSQAGFERAFMEELSFEEQIRMMSETQVLLAPHGAGLTNIIFCRPGAHVVEIADLGYPNPNFYALASAMDLHYWLVPGQAVGDGHPLDVDLRVGVPAVRAVLDRIGDELGEPVQ